MSSDATRHTTGKLPSGSGSERIAGARCVPSTVLDDYQYRALSLAGWSVLARGRPHSINDQLADSNTVAALISLF
jgi:hypothetical protein